MAMGLGLEAVASAIVWPLSGNRKTTRRQDRQTGRKTNRREDRQAGGKTGKQAEIGRAHV